jgi:hypothetical protein
MDKPDSGGGLFGWVKNLFVGSSAPSNGSTFNFDTNLDANDMTMLSQLQAAQQYRNIILSAASRFNFPPSVICGIGSRESHWGLANALHAPHAPPHYPLMAVVLGVVYYKSIMIGTSSPAQATGVHRKIIFCTAAKS